MQTFGEQLAAARRAKGMTQEALSQAADVARKLSDILGCDLTQQIGAADAASRVEAPMESQKRRFRRPWLIAGAALIVCAAVCVLLFARRGAPPAGQDAFPLDTYRQEIPNEADKAYLTFDTRAWEEKGDNDTYQRYAFTMHEKNGIGFSISSIDLQMEGKSGTVRSATYGVKDLRAVGLDPDIEPYGTFEIEGGFPLGEFLRAGMAAHGTDANGATLTFYGLVEF